MMTAWNPLSPSQSCRGAEGDLTANPDHLADAKQCGSLFSSIDFFSQRLQIVDISPVTKFYFIPNTENYFLEKNGSCLVTDHAILCPLYAREIWLACTLPFIPVASNEFHSFE